MLQRSFFHVEAIQNEYRRIDGKCLRAQYRLMMALATLAVVAEVGMFFLLRGLGLIRIDLGKYAVKYLVLPACADAGLLAAATAVMRSRVDERRKIYGISLLMALMALLLYTVHSVFPSLFFILVIPMVLTVIYGDRRLTSLVSAVCLVGKVLSDLFIFWDPTRQNVFSSDGTVIDFSISILLLVMFYGICWFLLTTEQTKNEVSIKLEQERERFWEESLTDALTRVGNRQALREAFQVMEQDETGRVYYLAMMDLDDFKSLNDTYGHNSGDQYLKNLGEALLSVTSEEVRPFRFGGDEFCVLFGGLPREQVRTVCRRIQEDFGRREVQQTLRTVSVSIGVARYVPGTTPSELLNQADRALYQAKQEKGSIHICERECTHE